MYNKNKYLTMAVLLAPLLGFAFLLLQGASFQLQTALPMRTIALVVVLIPICEEIVFRGLLQHELASYNRLRQTVAGLSWDNIISSTLFSVTHALYFGNALVLLLEIPALILGLFYSRQRKLIYPICLHAWYNANGLLVFALLE